MANQSKQKNAIRIVVAGDKSTGKSSLIVTAVSETFRPNPPPVLPPSRLPDDLFPDSVPITIIDTPSSVEYTAKRAEEFQRADAVVLTYACDDPETLENLSSYWLPELRRLEVNVPVIVVGCKLDLRDDEQQVSLEQVMSPIMQQFREIETCIECSAYRLIQIREVFYYAQKAVIHPTAPLFDQETQTLRPQCVKALKRIFILCDNDKDGALSDAELNEFQVKCFNAPLQPSEISGVKRVVQEKLPEGVNERGLTLRGFLFLHALFIEKGRLETTWTVLRKFGYNNDIRLDGDFLPPSFKRASDQSVELTNDALDFLRGIFSSYDNDNDGAIRPADVDDLFSTAPDCPWSKGPYQGAASTTALGGLTLHGFISEWALMTLLEPSKSVEYLKYVMYGGDATSAIRLTRRRRTDRKRRQSERNVYQCFVFGPKKAGKSALLDAFLGRPFSEAYNHNTDERYAVNVVDGPAGSQKFLVLREIPEDKVKNLLSDKESLAACDVALFLYDSTDESSFKKTAELLVEVAGHGEDSGYEVPSLIVSAKDDEDSYTTSIQDSTRVVLFAALHFSSVVTIYFVSFHFELSLKIPLFGPFTSFFRCHLLACALSSLYTSMQQQHYACASKTSALGGAVGVKDKQSSSVETQRLLFPYVHYWMLPRKLLQLIATSLCKKRIQCANSHYPIMLRSQRIASLFTLAPLKIACFRMRCI